MRPRTQALQAMKACRLGETTRFVHSPGTGRAFPVAELSRAIELTRVDVVGDEYGRGLVRVEAMRESNISRTIGKEKKCMWRLKPERRCSLDPVARQLVR